MAGQRDTDGEGRRLSLGASLAAVGKLLDAPLRRKVALCLGLMLVGVAAELVTIGAVLPFLALLVAPEQAADVPGVGLILGLSGGGSPGEWIAWSVLLLSVAAIGSAAIRLVILRYTQNITLAIGHRIGCMLYGRVLHQPYPVHLRRNPSEVLAGVEKAQTLTFALLMPLMNAAVAAVLATAIFLLLLAVEPVAASAAGITAVIGYVATSRLTRRRLRENSRVLAQAASARYRLLQESIGGIREILLGRFQPDFEDRYRNIDLAFRRAHALNLFVGQAPRYVVEAAGIVLMGLLALYLSTRAGGLAGAIPVLGVIALGAQRLLPLLQQIYAGWSQASGNLQAIGDVIAMLEEPLPPAAPAAAAPLPFRHSIRFEQVSFAYSSERPALRDVTLEIPKGARLAVVGRTGSGKSTLLDLLNGLLRPTAGRILVDGVPLDEERLPAWQARLAVVPQQIYLADRSIAANIAFGEPPERIDMERVRAAARDAALDPFVAELPQGYDTMVGERGVSLSGGQRQRVAIARALYRRATVLIFDEATSALDRETEAEILATLAELGSGITIVTVSHHLTGMEGCDLIVRLHRGTVAEIEGPAAAPHAGAQAAGAQAAKRAG